MKKCSSCRYDNADNAKYCIRCGTPLPEQQFSAQPNVDQTAYADPRQPNNQWDNAGLQKNNARPPHMPEHTPQNINWTMVALIAAAVLLIAAVVLVGLFFVKDDGDDSAAGENSAAVSSVMEDGTDTAAISSSDAAAAQPTSIAGTYAVRTAGQTELTMTLEGGGIYKLAYGSLVYVLREEYGAAEVSYCGLTGKVRIDALSWVCEEDRTIQSGDICYVHKRDDSGMNLRSESNSDSESIATLYYGTTFQIDALKNGWGQIVYGEQTGWVLMSRIAKFDSGLCYVADNPDAGGVGIWSQGSSESEKLGSIPNGTVVMASGCESGWGLVTYQGVIGYAKMYNLTPVSLAQ